MFDILFVLVKNHGQIVSKEVLLTEVWPDSFVEEGNISFNIRQLRKALDDDARSPKYIETISRRGYRFVAKVETRSFEGEDDKPDLSAESPDLPRKRFLKKYIAVAVIVVVLAASALFAWIFLDRPAAIPLLSESFATEKLSTTGFVYAAAISPDGKRVVYSNRVGNKESVWMRELESESNIEIIPHSDSYYFGFTFAPDGNSLYFSRSVPNIERRTQIARISVFGGIPEKIIDTSEGFFSVSPDGNRISYVDCPQTSDEWCSLWIADSQDGKNARKLLSRANPIRIGDVEISPDGAKIVFAQGQSRNGANEFSVFEVDLISGAEIEITKDRFFNVKSLTWLPDQRGLLMTASRIPDKYFRIWQVSTADGSSLPLTEDSETYSILSLDKPAKRLVSTQVKQDFRLNIFDLDKPGQRRFLANASTASFSHGDKIYYSSSSSGNDEIWSIGTDGNGQRQLTADTAGDRNPIASHDGKAVYFTSNRSGEAHIWKMDADGGNQSRVTKNEGGSPIYVSNDGKTLFYRHFLKRSLWSVSLESGEEKVVLDRSRPFFAFSNDGTLIAYEDKIDRRLLLTIVTAGSGETIKSLALPTEKARLMQFAWMPNDKEIILLMSDADFQKNAIYRLQFDGMEAKKFLDLDNDQLAETFSLSVSSDGSKLAIVQGGWKHDAVLFTGLK